MRLLLTTDTLGGVWTFTAELARGLLAGGHAVALVSFGRLPSAAQSAEMAALAAAFADDFDYTASDAPLEWMAENDRAWPEGREVLDRVIGSFAPDLLHASQFCFGRFSAELPVLVTAHSDVMSWAESALAPEGLRRLERSTSPAWLRRYRELVSAGLAQATAVVAPTAWMAGEATRLYNLERTPEVIANGIFPGCTDFAGSVPRKLQAVTAGRLWDKGKGLAIVAELAELTNSDPPLPVFVAGEQSFEGEQAPAGVHWLGSLPRAGLQTLFAQSAMYIAASLYEPFGLAAVEAAQCGCAVVARDLPSFREVWDDAALYFDSAATLEQLLRSLAANPRRLQGARCRARERAAHYTADRMVRAYAERYGRLVAAWRPAVMPIPKPTGEPALAHA